MHNLPPQLAAALAQRSGRRRGQRLEETVAYACCILFTLHNSLTRISPRQITQTRA